MATATPEAVAAFLGKTGDASVTALATQHLSVLTGLARGYTRDQGFTDDSDLPDDLVAVLVAAAARSVSNPDGTTQLVTGPMQVSQAVFNGFTVAELAVLNRYRRRAA